MPWHTNNNLHESKKSTNAEFYTLLPDIEKELKYYKEYFRWKVVFCNCDDPYESNFFKYFAMNFNFLWLKKLIATSYSTSPIAHTQLTLFWDKKSYKIEINEVYDANWDWAEDIADVKYLLETGKWKNKLVLLKWDGDFRGEESINLLKQSDIVVTNPPFPLFRQYISQLIQYNKKFLIIGNSNAITYKDVFPFIKANKLWLWITRQWSGSMRFKIPDNAPIKQWQKVENGIRYQTIWNSAWFTNLNYKKRHEELLLYKKYNPNEYPKYDNYDVIHIEKVVDIPIDYDWVMWVPITFLWKYNPEQFEILWCSYSYWDIWEPWHKKWDSFNVSINGVDKYKRLFIRHKK